MYACMFIKLHITDNGTKRIYFLRSSYLSLECLALPSLLPFYFQDVLGRHLLKNQYCPADVIDSYRPSFPRFSHRILYIFLEFLAHIRPSSAFPVFFPSLRSLRSGPLHDATGSLLCGCQSDSWITGVKTRAHESALHIRKHRGKTNSPNMQADRI